MKAKVTINCDFCGKLFERGATEFKRNKKYNRQCFCSRQCAGKKLFANLGDYSNKIPPRYGSTTDSYSPFRNFLRIIKNRCEEKDKEFSLTLEDLKIQWDKQKGVCPYTGWELKIFKSTKGGLLKTPDRASVDRIDSSKGYLPENIQFVSLIAQYAKNEWDEQALVKFCRDVTGFRNEI